MIKFNIRQLDPDQLEVIHGITSESSKKLKSLISSEQIEDDSQLTDIYEKAGIPRNMHGEISKVLTVESKEDVSYKHRLRYDQLTRDQLVALDGIHKGNVDRILEGLTERPAFSDQDIKIVLYNSGVNENEADGIQKLITVDAVNSSRDEITDSEYIKSQIIRISSEGFIQAGHALSTINNGTPEDVFSKASKIFLETEKITKILGKELGLSYPDRTSLAAMMDQICEGFAKNGDLLDVASASLNLSELFHFRKNSEHVYSSDLKNYRIASNHLAKNIKLLASNITKSHLGSRYTNHILSSKYNPSLQELYAPYTPAIMHDLIRSNILQIGIAMRIYGEILKDMLAIYFDLFSCKDLCDSGDGPKDCFIKDIIISTPIYGDIEMTATEEAAIMITTELIDLVLELSDLESPTGDFEEQVEVIIEQIKKYQDEKKKKIREMMGATSFDLHVIVEGNCCETKTCVPWFLLSQKKWITRTKTCEVPPPPGAAAGPPEQGAIKGEKMDLTDPDIAEAIVKTAAKCCKELCG